MATTSNAVWVDRLCDRFEAGWKAGAPVAAEVLLAECPDDARRHALTELLALEQKYRAKAGRPLDRAEAVARFGGLGAWAETVLNSAFPLLLLTVEVIGGPHTGECFTLSGRESYTVGRQAGHAITLDRDAEVSRVHLMLSVVGNGNIVRVIDLGSSSGTFVNGQKLPQADLVGVGVVRLGKSSELRLTLSGPGFDETVAPADHVTRWITLSDDLPAIPGYQLQNELGRGAMGVVYRAVRDATGETVALKTILPALAPTRSMVARFRREADILAKLSHPNVVGFRESGAASGVLFVAMELVPGRSVSDVARDGPIPPERLRQWADHLLLGLSHAHTAGIVHRDVKPGNLLVTDTPDGDVLKVADFGLARAYESSGASGVTADGMTCGTLAFMPPEQITDVKRVGPAADQYAAAATLYLLLTGQPIYPPERTAQAQVDRILTDEPLPLRPGAAPLPEPFDRVIRRALARDPKARYPSCEAMRSALQRG